MRNLARLPEAELKRRAKELYFDKNKNIKVIFADEFGRFSYSKEALIEQNEQSTGVFEINAGALKEDKTAVTDKKPVVKE
jgi:hypothetical protein